jgi:hypothetical protein
MLKYKIIDFIDRNPSKINFISDGQLAGAEVFSKNILIPFNQQNKNDGYESLANQLFIEEKNKTINITSDNEKIKFKSANYGQQNNSNLDISFYFYNTQTGNLENNYKAAGFTQEEITGLTNNITNSFYRLDFYDSDDFSSQNFLFSEFLNIYQNTTSTSFPLKRLFWLKNDPKFIKENTFRTLYFEATFFDSKTGIIKKFINSPSGTNTLTLSQYNANPQWRFAKLRLLNPYITQNNVGSLNRIFYVEPSNGNTDDTIIFNEVKIN